MKKNPLLIVLMLAVSLHCLAQNKFSIAFRNGAVQPQPNLRQSFFDSFNTKMLRVRNKGLVVLQFYKLPNEAEKNMLRNNGVALLEYLSGNAYTAAVTGVLQLGPLKKAQARFVMQLAPEQKMNGQLAAGRIPAWALKNRGTVAVWVQLANSMAVSEAVAELKSRNFEVLFPVFETAQVWAVSLPTQRIRELAMLPFVAYVQPAPPADAPLNYNSRAASGANILNASPSAGGKNLDGQNVVIGIGDNADVQTHVDFANRLINRAASVPSGHGQHVTGTAAGAGNINPIYRGYAPKATIISQDFSAIIANAATYVHDFGMVITNNSYGSIVDCDYHGTYDMASQYLDQMAFDLPYLQNVFAAGNSGQSACPPALPSFRTVLGSYQSAKNVLTVGATNDSGVIASFSSRGPVKDGRTKPEIVAVGENVVSAWPTNLYVTNSGTSMAAPAVSGAMALLYERYRQLNSGANPKNGLIKALLCNGASDVGTTGADFTYGFGSMNLLRSIAMLENTHYFVTNVSNGSTNAHTISIPANTAQLKVMLYWNDPAASLLSSKTLVNDLDLTVAPPAGAAYLPWMLDSSAAGINNTATTGADHTNNMEQVVIAAPAAGSYTISVAGTAIAQNPTQEYFLVYDVVPVELQLTAPAGSEPLVPGTVEKIRWNAFGLTGSLMLEYSVDGGANWTTIATGVDVNRSLYSWQVPNVATTNALVRISNQASGLSSTCAPFAILEQPEITMAPLANQCEGYINFSWTPVSGATDYEIYLLQGTDMVPVATTTASSYTFSGLRADSIYYVSVAGRKQGVNGRRAVAKWRQPNNGTCSGTISDNDLELQAIVSPVSGRQFTSTALAANSVVSVKIKNLDNAPSGSFTVQYSINNGLWVTEVLATPIAALGSYTHQFATPANLSAAGQYIITAVVKNNAGDAVVANDTFTTVVNNLPNAPINLTQYWIADFEAAPAASYQNDTMGLAGLEQFDFMPFTINGRLRTFVNTGIAFSGNRALTLDASQNLPSRNLNHVTATCNLSNYSTANDLRLDFQYLSHGENTGTENQVWIRGSDTQTWIPVFDMMALHPPTATYIKTPSIEISHLLDSAGQTLSSSFQVRWGQFGALQATEREKAAGITIDDVRLYQAQNDLQLKSITAPAASSCGLGSAAEISILVRNSSNQPVYNVPVQYRINGNAWVVENIPVIGATAAVAYTFSGKANLSAFAVYNIEAVVSFSSDDFRENDTLAVEVRNAPVITSFPYLQNFENNDGNWYAGGSNNSWQYGTPASTKISTAASGAKAWKTNLLGAYNNNEKSYLYSPCFNIGGMTAPTLSFSLALDVEDCGSTLCDAAWVEYSADGTSWTKLSLAGSGTNWYNNTAQQVWSQQNATQWRVATAALPTGISQLRLRFVFQSDMAANREGVAIDDIHIYDNTMGIYDGGSMASPVVQLVDGNNWVHFTEGGKLLASIHPKGQALGATAVQAYIFNSGVRNNSYQYYHDRNITIKPANNNLSGAATVRFYFLDSETNDLINASGCATCSQPKTAYELGVSKYTDSDKNFENGTIADNLQGNWNYMKNADVQIVPFDKGYYAEFEVTDFSEFWLNNGGFDKSTPLPVALTSFTAQKAYANNVLLKWQTAAEENVAIYEVQLAYAKPNLQPGNYTTIGTVKSKGASGTAQLYQFIDSVSAKTGKLFYRLMIRNADGSIAISKIASVNFEAATDWQVFPNPSSGKFNLMFQLNPGALLKAQVFDAAGRSVAAYEVPASGAQQKLTIDLLDGGFAPGLYLLKVQAGNRSQLFKIHKN